MGVCATAAIERCGPPEWSAPSRPSRSIRRVLSAVLGPGPDGDPDVVRPLASRRRLLLVYGERDAHCEADGVVGGVHSRLACALTRMTPRLVDLPMARVYLAIPAMLATTDDLTELSENLPFWAGHPDAAAFEHAVDARLEPAPRTAGKSDGGEAGARSPTPWCPTTAVMRELDRGGSAAGLIAVHPDSALRETAERSEQRVSAFATDLSLDRRVFDASPPLDLTGPTGHPALRAADSPGLPSGGRGPGLRDPRPDQGAARRAGRHRPGVRPQHPRRRARTIEVAVAAELDGLPADYIAAHPAGPTAGSASRPTTPMCSRS